MSKEVKIGIIGLVVFFTLIYSVNYTKKQNLFSTNMVITAQFDAIDFVKVGAPVYVRGRIVGEVVDVFKEGEKLYLNLDIEPINILPKNTKASIYSESILGGTAITLLYEEACESNCLETGDRIEGSLDGMQQTVERAAKPILDKLGTAADRLNNDSTGIDKMLEEAYASIHALEKRTAGWKGSAYKASKSIPVTVRNLRDMTGGLVSNVGANAEQQAAIDSLLQTMSNLTQEDIDEMVKVLYTAAEELPKLEPLVNKSTTAIPKINNQIDSVNLLLESYLPGGDNTKITQLLYDEALKDTTQVKIQGMSTTIGDIRKYPQKYLSLKKK